VSPTHTFDPRIDAYIAKSKPFAQPILNHIRELLHKACPGVVETIKWSRPFFEYKGVILANVSAFKEHCSFGFWGEEIAAVLRDAKLLQPDAMGSLGRLTRIEDLPADKQMLGLLRQAVAFIDSGQYTSSRPIRRRPPSSPPSAPVANGNMSSGSPTPSATRHATSASPRPSSGSAKANNATGNTRTAEADASP
jgi:hypothetical protein